MSTEKKRPSKLVTPPREYSEKTMQLINQGAGNIFSTGSDDVTEMKQAIAQIMADKTAAKDRGEFEVKTPRRDKFSEAFKEALSKK